MQRIRKRLGAGLIPGLFLISAAPAQAQTSYVQSAGFRSVRASPTVEAKRLERITDLCSGIRSDGSRSAIRWR